MAATLTQNVKVTVSGNYTYVAKASVGTSQAMPSWQCERIEDDGTTVTILWANGNDKFINTAVDLTSLSYF